MNVARATKRLQYLRNLERLEQARADPDSAEAAFVTSMIEEGRRLNDPTMQKLGLAAAENVAQVAPGCGLL